MVNRDRAAILSRRAGFVAATLIGVGCTPTPAPVPSPHRGAVDPTPADVVEVPAAASTGAPNTSSVVAPPPSEPSPKPPPAKICDGPVPAQATPIARPTPGICLSLAVPGFHSGIILAVDRSIDEEANRQLDEIAPLVKRSRLLELHIDATDTWREIGAHVKQALVDRGVPPEIICVRDSSKKRGSRHLKDDEAIVGVMLRTR